MPLTNLISRFQEVQSTIDEMVIDAAFEFKDDIVKMNIEQLDEGLLSTGEPIEPLYTSYTIKVKQKKNQRFDVVTLEDEGDFKNDFFADRGDDWISMYSEDSKTKDLVEKYGVNIFGLMQENINTVAVLSIPNLINKVNRKLS